MRSILLSGLLTAIGLSACAQDQSATPKDTSSRMSLPSHIEAAIAHPERIQSDIKRDELRLPGEILATAGLQPGMTILEIEAGKGYFPEILAAAIGDAGQVHVQNPSKLDRFFGNELEARLKRRNLMNVTIHRGDFDALGTDDNAMDLVIWGQGPHEIWLQPDEGVSLGDPQGAFDDERSISR